MTPEDKELVGRLRIGIISYHPMTHQAADAIERLSAAEKPGYWRKCHDIAEATNEALRAEIKRLSAEVEHEKHLREFSEDFCKAVQDQREKYKEELAALRVQLMDDGCKKLLLRTQEELRKRTKERDVIQSKYDLLRVGGGVDVERYRWLRHRDVRFETDDGMESVTYIPELGHDGTRLDAAIDAAMKGSA